MGFAEELLKFVHFSSGALEGIGGAPAYGGWLRSGKLFQELRADVVDSVGHPQWSSHFESDFCQS